MGRVTPVSARRGLSETGVRPGSRSTDADPSLPGVASRELDDLAVQAAKDALVAILARLDESAAPAASSPGPTSSPSRPRSSCAEASGRAREVSLELESLALLHDDGSGPQDEVEHSELLAAVREGISTP